MANSFTIAQLKNLAWREDTPTVASLFARGEKAKGRATYKFQKKISGSQDWHRESIGTFPDMSITEAEENAQELRKLCNAGINPKTHNQKQKEIIEAESNLDSYTLRWGFEYRKREVNLHTPNKIKDKSWYKYEKAIQAVTPNWWDLPLRQITPALVKKTYEDYINRTGKQEMAKYWHSCMKTLFKHLDDYEENGVYLYERNPFSILKNIPTTSNKREGYLKQHEIRKCYDQFYNQRQYKGGFSLALEAQHWALFMMAFTGLRKSEVLQLQWNDLFKEGTEFRGRKIDKDNGFIRVYIKKKGEIGKGKLHYIPLTWPINNLLLKQSFIRTEFLKTKHNYSTYQKWEANPFVFFSFKYVDKALDVLDPAVKEWRQWLGNPEIWQEFESQNKPLPKHNRYFSCHWLRHSFTHVARSLKHTAREVDEAVKGVMPEKVGMDTYVHETEPEFVIDLHKKLFLRVQNLILYDEYEFEPLKITRYGRENMEDELDTRSLEPPPEANEDEDLSGFRSYTEEEVKDLKSND